MDGEREERGRIVGFDEDGRDDAAVDAAGCIGKREDVQLSVGDAVREKERTLPRDSADKCGGEAERSGGVGRSVGRGSRVAEWLLFSFPLPPPPPPPSPPQMHREQA